MHICKYKKQKKQNTHPFDLPQAVGMLPCLRPLMFFLTLHTGVEQKILASLIASSHAYGLTKNVTRLVT